MQAWAESLGHPGPLIPLHSAPGARIGLWNLSSLFLQTISNAVLGNWRSKEEVMKAQHGLANIRKSQIYLIFKLCFLSC